MTWETDEEFIKAGGNNFLMTFTNDASLYQMKTLRSFYYSNYNNLIKPLTFILEVDGKPKVTVENSLSDEPVYHKFVFFSEKSSFDVCMIRAQEDHVPFISTIESTLILDLQAYRLMPNQKAL
ncbi:Malectin-like carbohydrate-binding domain containing protein [Parasponia andersonii]|uniref:Malectin-like carbohydrate-binding domain containing protein n=1 Tax=Parasponia andersonii TaxID=3476 RepID=A0A2P5D0Z3_PARAD|nr:Malectin-like carbohydrate-binding domain containing protein [Parasponia andersonii]